MRNKSKGNMQKQEKNEVVTFLKTFLVAFLIIMCCATPLFAMIYEWGERTIGGDGEPVLADEIDFAYLIPTDSPFFNAFTDTDRVNILAMGVDENNLTDTIMLFSFDIRNKYMDVISIPRDTYYYRGDGNASKAQNKINAAYRGNPVNTARAVSEILMNIPINYYVTVSYEGIKTIIDDGIGGVPMDIPFHMKYDDPYDKPPLHVDIKPGPQILDGETSIKFLRFRQGNTGYKSYPNADIGRIKAQQDFLKSAAKECLGFDFLKITKIVFENITTDITYKEALNLATKAIGIEADNIRTYQMPYKGNDVYPDTQGIADMLTEIYSLERVIVEDVSGEPEH